MRRRDDQPEVKEKRSAGRPPALKPEHVQLLCELAMADTGTTLDALAQQLQQRCGVEVCTMTIRRALAAAGIKRVKPTRRAVPQERGKPARYGYTEAHRREADAAPYSCALTPAEWALVADLFERDPHTRGAPGKFERKALVDACCLRAQDGLRVAAAAARLPALDHRVQGVRALGRHGPFRVHARPAAGTMAATFGAPPWSHRRSTGLAVQPLITTGRRGRV
jgi:Transposase